MIMKGERDEVLRDRRNVALCTAPFDCRVLFAEVKST